MKENKTIKMVVAVFLITLCLAGTAGGFVAVQDTATANSTTVPLQTEEKEENWLGLPPRWQALLSVTRFQEWLWEYYFTVLAKP